MRRAERGTPVSHELQGVTAQHKANRELKNALKAFSSRPVAYAPSSTQRAQRGTVSYPDMRD